MAERFEGDTQLNEILFQTGIDSFPHRDNYEKIASVAASHATDIEALENGGTPPASSSAEVIAARDQAASLADRIEDSQAAQAWGVSLNVLNMMEVAAQGTPDDTVEVDTGQGVISGTLFRKTGTQTVDPADFALAVANPRIDVVYLSANGVAGVTTGLPAATPLPEKIPNNTIEIARLWLEPSGGNPNVPNDIKDFNDGTNSYIMLRLDRFLPLVRETRKRGINVNQIRNGDFNMLDDSAAIWAWTATNASIAQDADSLYGDSSMKITNDGTNSQHKAGQTIAVPAHLTNSWVTVSLWIKLSAPASGDISCAVKIRLTGDSPEGDITETARINSNMWQRVIAQAYIDNDTTAIDIEVFPDGVATQVSTTAVFVDGVMMTRGLEILGYEYPARVFINADGSATVFDLEVLNDLEVLGDVTITGTLFSSGATDVISFLAL